MNSLTRFQCEEERGEEIAWIHSPLLFVWRRILLHSLPHDITRSSAARVLCSHSRYAYSPTAAAFGPAQLTERRHTTLTKHRQIASCVVEFCLQAEACGVCGPRRGGVRAAREVLEHAFE